MEGPVKEIERRFRDVFAKAEASPDWPLHAQIVELGEQNWKLENARKAYIRHIRRLAAENLELRAAVAEEQRLRIAAWAHYRAKVRRFWPILIESWLWTMRGGK
jgi:hypothetical protein